jgi:DNA replication protein DnaC
LSNSGNCLLSSVCKEADSPNCNNLCSHFISLHGFSGKGGRSALLGLPNEYRLFTLNNSVVRSSQPKVYSLLDEYVKTFDRYFEGGNIKSLYLWSNNPGTGKTSTAASLINTWLIAHYLGSLKRNRQAQQMPAVFLDVNSFQTDYNLATMTNDDAAMVKIKSTILRVQAAPFAVLDDIGLRSASEAFRSYVHAIVNYRTANGMPTIFTSNLPIEEMAVVFDARLYDRMRDMCAVLHFGGESKRGRR